MKKIANGIYKITLGKPEELSLVSVLKPDIKYDQLNRLEDVPCKFEDKDFSLKARKGYITVEIPLGQQENIYGFGLMLKSFKQTGLKKKLRANSDPTADTGDSHAPVPFYVSTEGYGIFVDTTRYATFHAGNCKMVNSMQDKTNYKSAGTNMGHWWIKCGSGNMFVDIPAAEGVDIYIFNGNSIKDVVARYNLFSGGGCFVPLWGLGIMYRAYMYGDQEHTMGLAAQLRKDKIPCDILGLEPGWQSHSYSCTYVWDKERFPDHTEFLSKLRDMEYKVNLWEHAYVNPQSPIYEELKSSSGNCYVWDGLVPDFTQKEAAEAFKNHHSQLKEQGISGFKLDEADNSDFTANWGFPDFAQFPSGLDGEQMHTLFGSLYQKTILEIYDQSNVRTFGESRQSTALAAGNPYVLYSDLYDHKDFIRGMAGAAFSGILWTPEVRQADSKEELLRRIESAVISPQTVINAYMVPSPPWKQFDYYNNLKGIFLEDAEDLTGKCRELFKLRMSLIPHLYTAYYNYYEKGIPPVRPLVMDYAEDINVMDLYDEYILGEGILAAPVIFGEGNKKRIYLPEGVWFNFHTNEKYIGQHFYDFAVPIGKVPIFVKAGTLLALAEPMLYIPRNVCFQIHLKAYGEQSCQCELISDDGFSNNYKTEGVKKILIKSDGNTYFAADIDSCYKIVSYECIK